jgi:hypothetical protein
MVAVRQAVTERFVPLISLKGTEPREGVLGTFGASCSHASCFGSTYETRRHAMLGSCSRFAFHGARETVLLVCVALFSDSTRCVNVSLLRFRPESTCSARVSLVEARGGSHARRSFRRPMGSETMCFSHYQTRLVVCVRASRGERLRPINSA